MFSKPKSPQASRGKYACANCKYRFSTSKPLSETSCPYCGSRRVTTMDELSADKLIHDATRREFDF
jgi:DNA-directed RNA polymerase subunit RPC12/RpoP